MYLRRVVHGTASWTRQVELLWNWRRRPLQIPLSLVEVQKLEAGKSQKDLPDVGLHIASICIRGVI